MEIFVLGIPGVVDEDFAWFDFLGDWDRPRNADNRCEAGHPLWSRVSPARIAIEQGSSMTLGDFSWTGYGTPLLQPRAAMTLATFNGVEFGDVQVEGNVPGSENLVELLAPVVVEADPRLSTFGISEEPCAHCGRHDWTEWDSEVNGVEHKTFRYEPATGESFHGKIGRRSGAGLILAGDALDGAEVFRFLQADWVVCTERVREAVETAELTNVGFRAIGEIR